MPFIRVLPLEVQREIAAGEVITRPADALKELLENALDAGATRLEISLEDGGIAVLSVTDDGAGIAADDLPLAPQRFATSKLQGALETVSTLGFRGEALWSIAFAARLRVTSRPRHQLGGVRLSAHRDQYSVESVACAAGTTVEVLGLFADLPARRGALESPALETRRCLQVVHRYALHHPGVAWRVTVDNDVRFQHASGDLRSGVASVYGAMTANRLLDVRGHGVEGVVSRPELTRPRRDRMFLAVNGRPVELEDGVGNAALRAFGTLLPRGHAVSMVLNLTVEPGLVNQNVHPGKLRVAFLEPKRLEDAVFEAVRASLAGQPSLVRDAPEPRAVSIPEPSVPSSLPALRFIGAYRGAYLIAEGDGDLWLFDQHAAHERVIFEELERAFDGASLELTRPELVTLSGAQEALLEGSREALEAFGLHLEPFGGGLHRVTRVPLALGGVVPEVLVPELVGNALSGRDPRREVLARFACLPAMKAGHRLSRANADALLEALRACAAPFTCPHGRPTALRLTEREVAHAFGRRGVRDLPKAQDVPVATVSSVSS
jgi:DNA mismatch repair protein MutL